MSRKPPAASFDASAQSDLIRHSVELTRVALVSSAPPALIFRGFSLVERSFGEKQRVQVNFTVTNRGGKLKLLHLPAKLNELLHVTQLITVFEVYEDEKEAVGSF